MQALGPRDYLRSDRFVRWFVHQSADKSGFLAIVLFTDEACFTWEEVSTAITASFGLKETLMLHLFTATNDAFHQHLDGH
jgi:hypothetical protein